jgi:hypothetical protein
MGNAFQGISGANQIVTTAGTSASKTIPTGGQSVRLVNAGATNPCHVRVGKDSQTATTADTVLLAGQAIVLHKADDDNTVAYIQSSGATTLHIQSGS